MNPFEPAGKGGGDKEPLLQSRHRSQLQSSYLLPSWADLGSLREGGPRREKGNSDAWCCVSCCVALCLVVFCVASCCVSRRVLCRVASCRVACLVVLCVVLCRVVSCLVVCRGVFRAVLCLVVLTVGRVVLVGALLAALGALLEPLGASKLSEVNLREVMFNFKLG